MGKVRKFLVTLLLVAMVVVIWATWGSIGSIMLTLALLLSLGYLLIRHIMEKRDPDDFDWYG